MGDGDRNPARMTDRWRLVCGAVAGPLFLVAALVQGAVRADYDPLRHPISSLALGPGGWVQTANFLVSGGLLVIGAIGLGRDLRGPGGSRWGPILVGVVGVGLIGAGVFTSDPISGYPPGSPARLVTSTTHGLWHEVFSTPVFLGLPAACFVCSRMFARRRERGWALYSLASGVAMVAAFVLSSMGFSQEPGFVGVGGLWQRVSLVAGLGWQTLIFLRTLNAARLRVMSLVMGRNEERTAPPR